MQPEFWQARWEQGQIGFHEGAPNRFLARYLDRLGAPGAVFVPLCGKTHDLDLLAAKGWRVTGSELVPLAVEQFFLERGITPATRALPSGTEYASASEGGASVAIVVGDVFAFEPADGPFDALFDRAALVAIAPSDRERYAEKLASVLRQGGRMLLVTFEHDLGAGPPHSVPGEEVERLFAGAFSIEALADEDVLEGNPNIAARGATRLHERAWLLERR